MNRSAEFLTPSEAAARVGVSAKALRLYEQRGWVVPVRTQAGWRAYGAAEMARAAEIVGLRALGLSLAQVGRVLGGEAIAWRRPWPSTNPRWKAGCGNYPIPWGMFAAFVLSSPAATPAPQARACWRLPPN